MGLQQNKNYDTIEVVAHHTMVVQYGQFNHGVIMVETGNQSYYDNGCVSSSLGNALQWQGSSGPLDLTTGQDAYECTGTLGNLDGSESLSPVPSPERSLVLNG